MPIQETQIRSRLRQAGLHGRISRKRPFISPRNAKKRLLFAREYLNRPIDFWNHIIFSDESKFEVYSHRRRRYCWRKTGEAFQSSLVTPTVKHGGGSVLVWGCFGASGMGNLVVIDGIFTGERYVHLLREHLMASATKLNLQGSFIFQQDNDPKHTSKVAKRFFEENNIQLLPWPPQSPDLNPIEHIWDHLDRNIPVHLRNNKPKFKEALFRVWNSTDQQTITKLIHSMPQRLQAVVRARGYQTNY